MTDPRPLLPEDKRTPAATEAMKGFHRDIVDQVRAAVEKDAVVVVGMAQNPVVKRVRQTLEQANIPFTYLEYGSYFGMWKQRLAIKLWSGWPTFPQVFVRGVLVGGFDDTRKALEDGSFKKLLGS
ncbi:glutaredoxin [Archangium gephyra]|uniref:Glutaredoxin n=1 Tax=Archangium gephyra TaxID=48 RepID=A0AAC8TH10_9BACT|nr:glutaredoxin domain-containing protein [Archangium gephyra]AKJ05747.1 Glutaredoxin-related protein [Archangium gephyra]REG36425.1 glutaredoxin [Archangium gephyra]